MLRVLVPLLFKLVPFLFTLGRVLFFRANPESSSSSVSYTFLSSAPPLKLYGGWTKSNPDFVLTRTPSILMQIPVFRVSPELYPSFPLSYREGGWEQKNLVSVTKWAIRFSLISIKDISRLAKLNAALIFPQGRRTWARHFKDFKHFILPANQPSIK